MLIRFVPPKLRPPGDAVLQIRRGHPLAAELRLCLVTGGQFGLGRDLVTGQMVSPVSAPTITTTIDGAAFDAAGTGYLTLPSVDAYNTTGPLTMAARANVRTSGGVLITKAPSGGSGATDTPFWFGTNANSLFSLRSNSGYVLWQSNSASLGPGTLKTHAVSSADIGTAPTFYYDGISDGAFVLFTNGGTGATNTNTNPVYIGQGANVGNQLDGQINIALVAAMLWPDAFHQRFHFEPYSVLEEAPRYYFSTPSAAPSVTNTPLIGNFDPALVPVAFFDPMLSPMGWLSRELVGPIAASPDITIALTGVQSTGQVGTVGVDVSVALVGVQGTGAVGTPAPGVSVAPTGVEATGVVGSVAPGVSVAVSGVASTGEVGNVTPEAPEPTGDTHDGYLRRTRRQRALDAAERRRREDAVSEALSLRLALEAAMGMAAEAVEDAPPEAVEVLEQVTEAARPMPAILARAPDWGAMEAARVTVAALHQAIAEAARAKALADDDDDVEILLRAL